MTEHSFSCPHCGKPCIVSKPERPPTTPPEKRNIEDSLREYEPFLEFVTQEGNVIVYPQDWLGKDTWMEINKIIKSFGGKWIAGGKDSHWEVPT